MCGRASQAEIKAYKEKIYEWLHPEAFIPRRNLHPTEPAWIVARRSDGLIKTIEARWWCQWDGSRQFEAKFPTFNARVETMHDKKLWPALLKKGPTLHTTYRQLLRVARLRQRPAAGRDICKGPRTVRARWTLEPLLRRKRDAIFVHHLYDRAERVHEAIHEKAMPVISPISTSKNYG